MEIVFENVIVEKNFEIEFEREFLVVKVLQMYYEMLSEYAPNDIQDEIERTQQRLDELKARIGNTES